LKDFTRTELALEQEPYFQSKARANHLLLNRLESAEMDDWAQFWQGPVCNGETTPEAQQQEGGL
jgi:hypothetical protein